MVEQYERAVDAGKKGRRLFFEERGESVYDFLSKGLKLQMEGNKKKNKRRKRQWIDQKM